MPKGEKLAEARRRRKELSQKKLPKCGNCGARTAQNAEERSLGFFWCNKCGRYPDTLKMPKGVDLPPMVRYSQKVS